MFYHTTSTGNEYDEAALWFHILGKDDDVPEPIFVPFESPTITEGTTKTITLQMGTQPVANPKGADCSVGSHSSPCIQAIVNYRKLPALSISYPTGNNPTWTVVSTASFNQGRTIFNENNWNSPQTITLTAPEDSNTSDESRDIAVSLYGVGYSSGGTLGYDNPQVTNYTVKVMDDDVQGEILFASGLEVSEGGSSTLSVSLSAKPRQPIQIGASSTLSRISLVPASFTIAPENWNKGRNVVVRSRDEEADNIRDADDESGRITMTTGDGLTTLSTTKNFTETDPEVEGAIEDRNKITLDGKVKVSEGGPGKIFVKLDTKPEYNTTLNIARSNNKLTVPASLTFTPQNWSDEQEILFRAGYDSGTNNASTTLTLSTTGGLITSPVTIPVDIISAGVHRYLFFIFNVAGETFKTSERFLYAQRPTDWKTDFGDTNWKEGETYTMTLKLSGPIPATWEREDLNEGLSGRNVWNKHRFRMYTNIRSGGNKASLSPRTWNFNEFNWNEAVTFTITTNEDDDGENDHFEVDFNEDAHTTAGSYIKGAGRMIIKFPTIVDDDVKGNIVLSTTRINSRDNGQSNNFTVKLNTKPTQDIIVTLRPATGGSIPSDVSFSKTSLTFTPTNYNQAQTITVRTYSDPDTQCDLSSYTLKAGDGYSGQSNLTVYVTDFDNEYC
ncbi:MAG: hypothetical protein ISN28_13635 [Ectothiorhodospiraceae bacterium AqS1]|nr:hypothetical protein [Ectothiorhodospiraceae bacterium AqS1]